MKAAEKRKRIFFIILVLLQVLVLAAVLASCRARYEVSDDFVMELIVTGAFDKTADPHMMFSSVIWGEMLVFFFRAVSWINWYLVWQMAAVLMTLACVSLLLVRSRGWAEVIFLLTVLHLYFGKDLYLLLQFTKIAAAAIAGGGCLFIRNLFHEKQKSAGLLGGGTLLIGCLIRHNALLIAGGYLAACFLLEAVSLAADPERDTSAEMKRALLRLLVLALAAAGLRTVNNLSYSLSPDYRYYMEYSYLRSAVLDGQLPDYGDCRKEFEEAGLSENDYMLIRKWCFADRSFFTPERMRQAGDIIENWRSAHRPDMEELKSLYEERRTEAYPAAAGLCILTAVSVFLSPFALPSALMGQALTRVLSLYLLWRGHMVYRVEFGLMFSQALLLLYAAGTGTWSRLFRKREPASGEREASFRKRAREVLSFMLVLSGGILTAGQLPSWLPDKSWEELSTEDYRKETDRVFNESWNYGAEKYTAPTGIRTLRPDFLKEVHSHPENLYLMDFSTSIQSYYYDFDPLTPLAGGSFRNTIYLGGVTVNHPSVDRALASWGLEEALPGLMEENVFLVSCNTQDMILQYLQSRYDPELSVRLVGEYDGYRIWHYERE